ncbi:MAG: hypothetical protein IPP68_03650 [Elusimicrobia bacterium]|nr:hypothetical protein [Elusimicrobiota bacterium]
MKYFSLPGSLFAGIYLLVCLSALVKAGDADWYALSSPWSILIRPWYRHHNGVMNYFAGPFFLLNASILYWIGIWLTQRWRVAGFPASLALAYLLPGAVLWGRYVLAVILKRRGDFFSTDFALLLYTMPGSLLFDRWNAPGGFRILLYPLFLATDTAVFYGVGRALAAAARFLLNR